MEQLLGAQQLNTIGILAQELDQELAGRINDLETIARTITPAVLNDTWTAQNLLEGQPVFSNRFNAGVYITARDGVATASVPRELERVGISYLDRDYLARAIQEGKSSVGEPVIGKRLGAPVVGLAVPIRNPQGAVIGALAGVIDLNAPSFMDPIAQRKIGNSGGFLLIAPKGRVVVVATDKSRVMEKLPAPGVNPVIDRFLAGYEGWATMTNPSGVEILAADKRVPTSGWIAASAFPTEEAFAPVRTLQQRLLWGSTALTLAAGGLVWSGGFCADTSNRSLSPPPPSTRWPEVASNCRPCQSKKKTKSVN